MRTKARTLQTTMSAGLEVRLYITPPNLGHVENLTRSALNYNSLIETISDEEQFKRRTGNCVHSRTREWRGDGEGSKFGPWSTSPTYMSTCTGSILYHYVVLERVSSTQRDLFPAVTINGFDWKSASFHALSSMRPSIDDGLLFPNFVAELAETGLLAGRKAREAIEKAERQRLRELQKLERAKRLSPRGWWRFKTLQQSLAAASDVWKRTVGFFGKALKRVAWANLAYQFAVQPTVSDAKKIVALIDNYRSIVSKLISEAKKRQIRHYKRPVDNLLTLPATMGPTNLSLCFGSSNTATRKSEWLTRPTYRASMLFTYDATALQGLLGKLDGLIHAFGVNRVASIIWEAIPFSFVVDWFVNVGDVIRSYEDMLLDPLPIVIHDFSHSLKYGYRTKLTWNWASKVITDLAYGDKEYYERRRDYPSQWDSLSVQTPNLNQVGLGASLVIVRMDGITNWKRR